MAPAAALVLHRLGISGVTSKLRVKARALNSLAVEVELLPGPGIGLRLSENSDPNLNALRRTRTVRHAHITAFTCERLPWPETAAARKLRCTTVKIMYQSAQPGQGIMIIRTHWGCPEVTATAFT